MTPIRTDEWRRAIDGEDPPCADRLAARMTNATPRHGPLGIPAEPTADKHEQRLEPTPSAAKVAMAVMAGMILGLAILAWSEWR